VPANKTINAFDDTADSMMLVGRVHVYSPDDLLADDFNRTTTAAATADDDLLDPFRTFATGNSYN